MCYTFIMKNKQKGFVIPILIAVIALLVIGGGTYVYVKEKSVTPKTTDSYVTDVFDDFTTPEGSIVGNDKDIHGCIGSAGYSWCEVKNKCLRVWEEKCEKVIVQPVKNSSSTCTPSWKCDWGTCVNGYQSQVVKDQNNCGLSSSGINIACPALAKVCSSPNEPISSTDNSCSILNQTVKDLNEPGPPKADENSCCSGLTATFPLQNFDSNCTNTYLERGPSGPANYLCLACGDGACDSRYENKCNCSADCK